jgi:hypothetical protein
MSKIFTQSTDKQKQISKNVVKFGCLPLGLILLLLLIIPLFTSENKKDSLTQFQKDSITHENWIKAQFSPWDGNHAETVKMIKNSMNDANSFKHIETTYSDFGKMGLVINTTFQGTNIYGAVVTNYAISKIDSTGKIYDFKISQ